MKKRMDTRTIRIIGWTLFAGYLIGLTYCLFFAESLGRTDLTGYHYNLRPFREIRRCLMHWDALGGFHAALNLFGNVIAFIPFGFSVPVLSYRKRKWYKVLGLGSLYSCLVELTQLVSMRGSCDVDDVILNSLGTVLGYGIFCLALKFRWRQKGKENLSNEQKAE